MNRHLRSGKGPTHVLIPGTWGDVQTFAPVKRVGPIIEVFG
jgi:hypothetical protein